MDPVLLLSQILASLVAGALVIRSFRRANDSHAQNDAEQLHERQLYWPRRLQWMLRILAPFDAPASRLAKPSERVRHALWSIGADHRFTDLEFSKMCWSMTLLATSVGVTFILVLWLMRVPLAAGHAMTAIMCCVGLPLLLPYVKLRDLSAVAQQNIAQTFPSFLDVLALTLESGQNFQSALQLSVQRMPQHGPSASLRRQLQEVLRAVRSGQPRKEALQQLAARVDTQEVTQFAASMSTAESQGVSVTALLRRQSEQLRTSRSLAAERHAMKLPVKLLAPLAICIFPCTFLIIAFPIAVRLSQSGLF